ncbi:HNH endonuclease [Actinoallomurus purpureus]|uniref:HNH endonuclease signature motif containing protein n=1 Tax=Actinoallomurus purpureus TaxID=478114 RepID=UPI002092AFEC|nr:HNH endonuclease signature motif containing protein [Actinoallomurus purpureus]MCO6005041.1 HNH endonuclease [Actinoallomurus purpureus]
MPRVVAADAMARAVGGRIGTVHLTVPLLTLLGLSAEPGDVAGYGPLTAEIARQMAGAASDPKTRWCVTVTGSDGEPLHHGHLGYRPPAEMAHVIRILQPTCVLPGCGRPASACDLDHRVPYDRGGATCPCNMSPLCRRHHRTKQADGWRFTEHDGWLRWTTPAGKAYDMSPNLLTTDARFLVVAEHRPNGPPATRVGVARSLVEDRWRKRIPGPPPLHRPRAGGGGCAVSAESSPSAAADS